MQLKNYKQVTHHLHQMMIGAASYKHLEINRLRELLAHGICTSFIAAYESKDKYAALPTQEQLLTAGSSVNLQSDKLPRYLNLSSENITTFYPLAEAFMGDQSRISYRPIKKKRSQQKGTKSQQVDAFILQHKGHFTKVDIQQALPEISLATITKVVCELRKAGVIDMLGTGADIQWYKK